MKSRKIFFLSTGIFLLLTLPLLSFSKPKEARPLYVFYEIHLDNAIFPDQETLAGVSKTLRRIADTMEKHNVRASFLVRPQYARAALQHKDTTLKELEMKGHEIGIHTHLYPRQTDTVADAAAALKQMGINHIISANPGFIIRPQMPGEDVKIMVEKFKAAVEEMKSVGIKIYAGAFGSGSYLPYSPFRPAQDNFYPRPGGPRNDIREDSSGPLLALHGTPAGSYEWRPEPTGNRRQGPPGGMRPGQEGSMFRRPPMQGGDEKMRRRDGQAPAVPEIQPHEMAEAVKPKLSKALQETEENYPERFNYFPIAIHELEFMNTTIKDDKRVPVYNADNKGFMALEKFLSEVIDPALQSGRIQWVTMAGLYREFIEYEQRARK